MSTPSILLRHQQSDISERHKADDQLHLMPFAINYEGPAEISKYFITRSLAPSAKRDTPDRQQDQVEGSFESSFRGRSLHGTRIGIPVDYLGLVCSLSSNSSSSKIQSNHQTLADSISASHNNLQQSSRSRPTTRARGRTRGRKLTQCVGTRAISSRTHLKRKHQGPNGFQSDDNDDDGGGHQNNDNQENDRDKTSNQSKIDGIIKERMEDTVSAEAEPGFKVDESSFQGEVEQQPVQPSVKLESSDLPINLAAPEPRFSVSTLDDLSHPNCPKVFQAIGSFDQFTIWNPDGPVDLPSDIYARSILDWVGLAQLLHSRPCST